MNSVGQQRLVLLRQCRDRDRRAIPGQHRYTEAFTPGVAPVELNTWLFWEPSDDPLGDAINGYEIEGRPIKVAGPRLFGGEPQPLADLGAVRNGPDRDEDGDPVDDELNPDTDTDNNIGSITIAGIHINGINLGAEAATDTPLPEDDSTNDNPGVTNEFDYHDVASRLEADIQVALDATNVGQWSPSDDYSHPTTVQRTETVDGVENVNVFYSTKSNPPAPPATDPPADPDSDHWTRIVNPAAKLNFGGAEVMYTGLRYVLVIPRAEVAEDEAGKLPTPSSVGSPNVASLLGWTGRITSQPEFKCCIRYRQWLMTKTG